jgi:hypothetical protein
MAMTNIRRYYQLARFRVGSARENLALIVKLETEDGSWTSRELRSFGLPTQEAEQSAEEWLNLLRQGASSSKDPVPIASLDRHLWEGLHTALRSPIAAIVYGPILPLRDAATMLNHLARGLVEGPELQKLVDGSQPELSREEKIRFLAWLEGKTPQERKALLTFIWRLPESEFLGTNHVHRGGG